MYQIIGYNSDGSTEVLEDEIISEGVARATLRRKRSEYEEEFAKVKIDNKTTPLGKM